LDANTNKVISKISVGGGPFGVAYDKANGYIYVANAASNTTSIIDGRTSSVVATVKMGTFPYKVVVDPSDQYIYVTNWGSNSISRIDPTTNIAESTNLGVREKPTRVLVNTLNGNLYVTSSGGSNTLSSST
jgi:YVTN family beta-propeller protein